MRNLNNRLRLYTFAYHLAWALLLGLLALLATSPAAGQLTHDFRLLPDPRQTASSQRAYFVYESTAGAVIHDAVLVRNESDRPLQLSLFSADTVTASRGGIAVASHSVNAAKGAGAWLHLEQDALSIEPREHHAVPFTLSLPADLSPGEYAASIVAQHAEQREGEQTGPMGVRFVPRFAVTVLVTIPGSSVDALASNLEITDLRAATGSRRQTVIADLENSGNDGLTKAEGRLTIRRTDGEPLLQMPVRLGYFLARDALDYRAGLKRELAPGDYDVTLSLTHERGTVELTRRLFFGELSEVPVVTADQSTWPENQPTGPPKLPRWVVLAMAAAGVSVALLTLLLMLQSRRLARARLKAD